MIPAAPRSCVRVAVAALGLMHASNDPSRRHAPALAAVLSLVTVLAAAGCSDGAGPEPDPASPSLTPTRPAAVGPATPGRVRPMRLRGVHGSAQNACWLDRHRIAFTQFSGGYNEGSAAVRWARLDGDLVGQAHDTPAQGVNMPAGCSAGGLLAFSADTDDGDAIMTVPVTGGRPRVVFRRPGSFAWEPTFSPDGRSLVFELHPFAEGPGELWIVTPDSATARRLTSGADDRQPVWAPSGERIVYQRRTTAGWKVWTIDPRGRTPAALTASGAGIDDTDASWSPDGRYIVYSSNDRGARLANLFAVPAGGGQPVRVTAGDGYDGAPAWSPDATRIAFEHAAGDPDGSSGTRLMVVSVPPSLATGS